MQLVTCHLLNGLGRTVDFAGVEIDEKRRVILIETGRASSLKRDALNPQGQFLLPGPVERHVHLTADADPVTARVKHSEGYCLTSSSRASPLSFRSRGALAPGDY